MRSVFALSALALVGCSFDLDGYHLGAGGASASTSVSGSESTAAFAGSTASGVTSTSVTSSGVTTGASTAESSSAGTGGAPPTPLAPCTGFTDDFQDFPSAHDWNTHDTKRVGGTNKQAQADIDFDIWAGAYLDSAQYSDCYVSIELVGQSGGNAYLNIYQSVTQNDDIHYDGDKVSSPNESVDVTAMPRAIGFALHGGNVYWLWMKNGEDTWQPPLEVQQAPGWMSDGANDALGFGVTGVNNDSATFDNFNVRVVTTADLP